MSRIPSSVILGIDQEGLSDKLLKFMVGPGSEFPENNALALVDRVLESHITRKPPGSQGMGSQEHILADGTSPVTREEMAFLVLRGAQALLDDGMQAREAEVRG